jgi:gamma-glutamylcyclotransferase (GGCT)/AIG2-like uncharacterized protein YtfP
MNSHFLLVYGTLRKFAERNNNFERFGPQKYHGDIWVNGYKLWGLKGYPFVTLGLGQVCCEIHEVTKDTYDLITKMEEGAGYVTDTINKIKLDDGSVIAASIYRMKDDAASFYHKSNRSFPIPSGDWNIIDGLA